MPGSGHEELTSRRLRLGREGTVRCYRASNESRLRGPPPAAEPSVAPNEAGTWTKGGNGGARFPGQSVLLRAFDLFDALRQSLLRWSCAPSYFRSGGLRGAYCSLVCWRWYGGSWKSSSGRHLNLCKSLCLNVSRGSPESRNEGLFVLNASEVRRYKPRNASKDVPSA